MIVVLQVLAVIAAVGAVTAGAFLVWLCTGPLGTLPLRVLIARLRHPHRPRQRHQLLEIRYVPPTEDGDRE